MTGPGERPQTPEMTREQRSVLLATGVSAFLGPFMGSALNLAIPLIGSDLQAPAVALSWILTTYLVISAALLLPFGRLADLRGRRSVFLIGAVMHAACSAGCATAASVAGLIAWRVLQGIGAAMLFATGFAILVDAFPVSHRGRMLGVVTSAVYAGLSLGPVVGGLLTQRLGWRSIFWLNAGLGAVVVVAAAAGLKERGQPAASGRFDVAGAALYAGAVIALIGGLSTLGSLPGADWVAVAGAVALIAFVAVELAVHQPMLELRLFRNAVFAFSNLAALIHYSATFGVVFLLSLYLQEVKGLGPGDAGMVLLAQPVVMALLSPVAGRLSDRIEPRLVASAGMLLSLAGVVPLMLLGERTGLAAVVVCLVVLGVGFGLFSSPNSNAVMSAVERSRYGVGAATLGTMRVVGQALSMAFVALIIGHHMGREVLGQGAASSLLAVTRTAFALFAGLCGAGLVASLVRGRVRPDRSAVTGGGGS